MHEHVIAFFRLNEPITLAIIEPLYCTLHYCTLSRFPGLAFKYLPRMPAVILFRRITNKKAATLVIQCPGIELIGDYTLIMGKVKGNRGNGPGGGFWPGRRFLNCRRTCCFPPVNALKYS